ncbi:hypothetical protein [Flavobacterium pectinovorum]|uniref:Uncharacterized protein n=1 Tax=Flavobacterium pectinovorum TaxID=29533 RepID=A0A502EL41_9FLAO|nr:hypothetical protein [Flavobacterium pectinovorum]TPG38473.1 hypothetical protein EAH81_16265 [Flavobacterium pectinovorum]
MDIILTLFGIMMFLITLVPFLAIAFLIFYVIKRSTKKKSPEFLRNEKVEMERKVNEIKNDIESWKNYTPQDITNYMTYSFRKSMSNTLTGKIYSSDNSPIIAFQRIDRGLYANARIVASTTDFKIYIEYSNNEKLFFFDDVYLGKIINNSVIVNPLHVQIGTCNRDNSYNQTNYTIELHSKKIAEINKNSDRKTIVKSQYYKPSRSGSNFKTTLDSREVEPSFALVNSIDTGDSEELKWIISIAIFESIYYGFDFTS